MTNLNHMAHIKQMTSYGFHEIHQRRVCCPCVTKNCSVPLEKHTLEKLVKLHASHVMWHSLNQEQSVRKLLSRVCGLSKKQCDFFSSSFYYKHCWTLNKRCPQSHYDSLFIGPGSLYEQLWAEVPQWGSKVSFPQWAHQSPITKGTAKHRISFPFYHLQARGNACWMKFLAVLPVERGGAFF